MKIAVVTDSGSGYKTKDCKDENLFIIPMPFMINGCEYFEDKNITEASFYEKLQDKNINLSTSQPSLYHVSTLWDEILKTYDAIIHIPLSSGLSATCYQALNLANMEYDGRVFVVDNMRVSATLKASVDDALALIKDGKTPQEIKEYLEKTARLSSIYIAVDTLTFLKKGGRITPQAAALGNLLRIKPILQIQGGKLDAYKKVMSSHLAKKAMVEAIEADLNGRFKEYYLKGQIALAVAHTNYLEGALQLKKALLEKFPNLEVKYVDSLSCVIACHTGEKALGAGCFVVYQK